VSRLLTTTRFPRFARLALGSVILIAIAVLVGLKHRRHSGQMIPCAPQMVSMSAHLYVPTQGVFSGDITAPGSTVPLWNTGGDSSMVLVKILVTGPRNGYVHAGSLRLLIRATKKRSLLVSKRWDESLLCGQDGRHYAAFVWAKPSWCEEVELVATLTDGKKRHEIRRSIPFECGE